MKHLAAQSPTSDFPRFILKGLPWGVVCAFLLEVGTILGTPGASVLSLHDWSKIRLVLFFAISLSLALLSARFDWPARFRRWSGATAEWLVAHAKAIGIGMITSAVAAFLLTAGITIVTGFSEPPILFGFLFVLTANVLVLMFLGGHLADKFEYFFLFCALSLGLWFSIASPVITSYSWDDQIHYARAESLSYITSPVVTKTDYLLANPEPRFDDTPAFEFSLNEQAAQSDLFSEYSEDASSATHIGTGTTIFGASIISTTTVSYIPSAIGLWVGRLLHLPFFLVFALGKIANLLFFSIAIFLGLRKLHSKKMLLGTIALLPTSLFLACNYSYDSWITALLAYAFCCFLSVIQRKDGMVTPAIMLKIAATSFLAILPKAIYFPILLIFLVMPRDRFEDDRGRSAYRRAILIASALALLSFLLPMVIGGAGSGDQRGGTGVDSSGQIAFIMSDVLGYMQILINFALGYVSPGNTSGYTGCLSYLGMIALLGPFVISAVLGIALLDTDEQSMRFARLRIWIPTWLLSMLTVGLVCTALYIDYTPVGFNSISGVQGRYLIPLLFPFMALGLNLRVQNRHDRNHFALLVGSLILVLLAVTFGALFVAKFVA